MKIVNAYLKLILISFIFSMVSCQSENNWPEIGNEQKPWTYWWWMGNAVDKENISWNLKKYQRAGLGGVQLATGTAKFDTQNLAVETDFKDSWNVLVRTNYQKNLMLDEEKGMASFNYTIREPRPTFCYQTSKKENQNMVRFVTLVAPYQSNQPTIQVVCNDESKQAYVSLHIVENGKARDIQF